MIRRPPSREDVQTAQSYLVLLKSKMRQRRQQVPPCSADGVRDQHLRGGRFERIPGAAGGVEASHMAAQPARSGVTWDPPTAAQGAVGAGFRQPQPDVNGYPSSPSQASMAGFNQTSPSGLGAAGIPNDGDMDDGGGILVPCDNCGRKFKEESLEKHTRICKKVFTEKRKKFNSAANRLGEFENAGDLIANAKQIEKEKDVAAKVPEKAKKVPKWKAESLAFRQAILAAKGAGGDEEAAKKAQELQAEISAVNAASGGDPLEADMMKCPHCGRTFNKQAGERHIAICVKTFGSKPGGGRLAKGGGVKPAAKPGTPPGAAREPSSGGNAVARRSSGQRRSSVPQAQVPPVPRGYR